MRERQGPSSEKHRFGEETGDMKMLPGLSREFVFATFSDDP